MLIPPSRRTLQHWSILAAVAVSVLAAPVPSFQERWRDFHEPPKPQPAPCCFPKHCRISNIPDRKARSRCCKRLLRSWIIHSHSRPGWLLFQATGVVFSLLPRLGSVVVLSLLPKEHPSTGRSCPDAVFPWQSFPRVFSPGSWRAPPHRKFWLHHYCGTYCLGQGQDSGLLTSSSVLLC